MRRGGGFNRPFIRGYRGRHPGSRSGCADPTPTSNDTPVDTRRSCRYAVHRPGAAVASNSVSRCWTPDRLRSRLAKPSSVNPACTGESDLCIGRSVGHPEEAVRDALWAGLVCPQWPSRYSSCADEDVECSPHHEGAMQRNERLESENSGGPPGGTRQPLIEAYEPRQGRHTQNSP